jgi:hypothetical protein
MPYSTQGDVTVTMFRCLSSAAFAAITLAATSVATAGGSYPWHNHSAPFDFVFGNHIDTHQQTRRQPNGDLWGFFYVRYTGTTTADGYRVATHVDCNSTPDCVVGWMLDGKPRRAALLQQPMHDHPIFAIARADIPQPGSYSHFHWLGAAMPQPYLPLAGHVLRLIAVERFCFIHHGAEAATPAVNCKANGGVSVDRGVDIATHLNLMPAAAHAM